MKRNTQTEEHSRNATGRRAFLYASRPPTKVSVVNPCLRIQSVQQARDRRLEVSESGAVALYVEPVSIQIKEGRERSCKEPLPRDG